MAITDETTQAAEPADCAPKGKLLRWFEVVLVLVLACGQSFLNSIYLLNNGPGESFHLSNTRWLIGIFHELTSLLLLGYVLSRRNLRFKNLGLKWSFNDFGAGLLVTFCSLLAYAIGGMFVHSVHSFMFPSAGRALSGKDFFAHPSIVAIPFSLLNPFFEELIVRAYLMTEVKELTGSTALSIGLSVLVQFSYHLYYGWEGALSLSFVFLVFAFYYARTRHALPIIVAHGFLDFYALISLW